MPDPPIDTTPNDPPVVDVIKTESAKEFIDKLHAISIDEMEEFYPGHRPQRCYRGVGSVGHFLCPPALRPDRLAQLIRASGAAARHRVAEFGEKANQPGFDQQVQMHREFGVLIEFAR